jgi:hypothetical protein
VRNKAQESILEPNLSLAHTFHELSFIFVCKNLMFLYTTRDNIHPQPDESSSGSASSVGNLDDF